MKHLVTFFEKFLLAGGCWLAFACLSQNRGIPALIGFHARYDSLVLPIFIGAFFYLLAKLPRQIALAGVLLLSASLCGLVLAGIRFGHVSDLSTLAGLYPHSDGRNYLNGALNLLHGQQLNPFASRRPLPVLFWAVLLNLGGMNINTAMGLMVFLCAMAIGFLGREVSRHYGWLVGCVVFLGLFLFYRRFIATFLTEHLGLALGCLGFVLLLRSLHEGRRRFAFIGLLLLTLALHARAGAFFILPTLALWSGRHWRQQARFSFLTCGMAIAVIGLGFALNALTLRTVGQSDAGQGNFSYTLYGLVHGGDWTLAQREHPELSALPETERHRATYDLAWKKIAAQPGSLLQGAARAWASFFCTRNGPYSFVFFALQYSMIKTPSSEEGTAVTDISSILRQVQKNPFKYLQIAATFTSYGLLFLLAAAGFFGLFKHASPARWLILSGWLGILASVPFIPPWDADLMRVHAATIPFILFPPAFGLFSLAAWFRKEPPALFCSPAGHPAEGLALPAGIILLFLLMPFLFKPQNEEASAAQGAEDSCSSGEPWTIRLVPGSTIAIHKSAEAAALQENNGILFSHDAHRAQAFLRFTSGQTLALGYERVSGSMRYLVLEDQAESFGRIWNHVCASPLHRDGMTTWWRINKTIENKVGR